jgi:hypothetical protein
MKVFRVECNGNFWNCETREDAEELAEKMQYNCVAVIKEVEKPKDEDPLYWKHHDKPPQYLQ